MILADGKMMNNLNLLVQVDTLGKFLQKKHPELREGQSYMNALAEINPELYKKITGTEADCFYDDKKIPSFFDMLVNS